MEGLGELEKRAFIGSLAGKAIKFFNPFKKKVQLSSVPSNLGIGVGLTLPFSTSGQAIKKTRGLKNVW